MTDRTPSTRGEGLVLLGFRIQRWRAEQMYRLLKPRAYPDAAYTFRDLMLDAINDFLDLPEEKWQVPYLPIRRDWEKPYRPTSNLQHVRRLQVSPELYTLLTTIKETRGWPTLAELLRFILDRYVEKEAPMHPGWYPRQRDYDPHYKPLAPPPPPAHPPRRQVPLMSLEEHNRRCRQRWVEKVEARKARRRRPRSAIN